MRVLGAFKSLSGRITSVVLLLLVSFSIVLGALALFLTTSWLERTSLDGLSALASARRYAVEAQVDRYLDMLSSYVLPDLESDLAHLIVSQGPERARLRGGVVRTMRRNLQASEWLVYAKVVDRENRLVAQTSEGVGQAEDQEPDFFRDALLRPRISHPFQVGDEWYIELGAPILNAQHDEVGVLVLRKRAGPLMAITGDYSGLGDTGETVLGDRRGDEVRFLVPLRFAPDPSGIDPVSASGERGAAMIRATAGQDGWIRSRDYRGESVVAVYRSIRQTGWGLVAKQDEDEIFRAVRDIRLRLALVIVALLGAATALVIPLVGSFVAPLRELERVTERVAGGDLETHVADDSEDEAGRLAKSFNRMIEQLKESRKELTRRSEEMGSFAHVVSHDLKAPLRAVATLAEWIKEDEGEKLGEEGRKQLDLMGERVRRMDALIDGLLQYSRIGRVSHREHPVDVETLVRTVVDDLDIREEIEVMITSPMPTLKTDEVLLSLVFRNLLDNAVKHHPGPAGVVEVSCQEREDHWEFAVADDGSGIDARHHDRVFGIFQRLGHEGEGVGTGLGLALVKKTVEETKGRVWIESDGVPGRGTTIRFTWPGQKEGQR